MRDGRTRGSMIPIAKVEELATARQRENARQLFFRSVPSKNFPTSAK